MRRSTAFLLVAIALIAIVAFEFRPEVTALAHHVRHGVYAQGAGLRVRVPLVYNSFEGPTSLGIVEQPGAARTRFSGGQGVLILISKNLPAGNGSMTMEQWWARTSASLTRQGARQTGTRNVSIAGRAERCYEYEGDFPGVAVWCVPESAGWIVDYAGPKTRLPEFYSLLGSAQTQ